MDQTPRAPKLDPVVADDVPSSDDITSYDDEHLVTYMRLLDADAEGADWRKWPALFFIGTRTPRLSVHAAVGRSILPGRAG